MIYTSSNIYVGVIRAGVEYAVTARGGGAEGAADVD